MAKYDQRLLEEELKNKVAADCFASHFMSDFLKGKVSGEAKKSGEAVSPLDRLAYYRSYELGKTWYDVADPNDLLTLKPIVIDSVDPTADRRAVKEIFRKMPPVRNVADGRVVRFTVREDADASCGNEFHGTTISCVCVYKAEGASESDPGLSRVEALAPLKATGTGLSLRSRTHGEDPVPFVDNKIALFLSAVNGGAGKKEGREGACAEDEEIGH